MCLLCPDSSRLCHQDLIIMIASLLFSCLGNWSFIGQRSFNTSDFMINVGMGSLAMLDLRLSKKNPQNAERAVPP